MIERLSGLYPFLFFGWVCFLAVWELIAPRRSEVVSVNRRWITNIGLYLTNATLQSVLVPISAVLFAESVLMSGQGLFQIMNFTGVGAIITGVLLLDQWKYFEHRIFHRCAFFWRIHLVHHSDIDVDFTTTERHHPLETLLGLGTLYAVIYLFGISAISIIIYILCGSVISLLSHANIKLPGKIESFLSYLVVTPRVHFIHHSTQQIETDSNFGLVLTVWDRIFGTFRKPTPADEAAIVIGLEYFRSASFANLHRVLCLPFYSNASRERSRQCPAKTSPLI